MARRNVATPLFSIVSALLLVAALLPLANGEPLQPAFLGAAVVFFVLAIAAAKRSRAAGGPPPGPG